MTMEPTREIAILARSICWNSALQTAIGRDFPDLRLRRALDIDDFFSEVARQGCGVGLLELARNSISSDCQKIAQTIQLDQWPVKNSGNPWGSPRRIRLLAVGDPSLRTSLPGLLACGFTDVCFSMAKIPALMARLDRCLAVQQLPPISIEESVIRELPWG